MHSQLLGLDYRHEISYSYTPGLMVDFSLDVVACVCVCVCIASKIAKFSRLNKIFYFCGLSEIFSF